MKFIKGNPDKPKGRVVVYAKSINPMDLGNPLYLATYGTIDEKTFARKAHVWRLSPSKIEFLVERAKADSVKYPWFECKVPDSWNFLSSSDDDIIEASKNDEDVFDMAYSVHKSSNEYRKNVLKQLKNGTFELGTTDATYKHFDGKRKEFLDHMNITYINPIIFARMTGNAAEASALSKEFFSFFSGSPYGVDVSMIWRLIEEQSANQKILTAVDLLAQRIAAQSVDDFESMAELTKKLDDILK